MVDVALKRSPGYLNSHRSDKKAEGKLRKSTERWRNEMLLDLSKITSEMKKTFSIFFFKGKTTQGLESKPFI